MNTHELAAMLIPGPRPIVPLLAEVMLGGGYLCIMARLKESAVRTGVVLARRDRLLWQALTGAWALFCLWAAHTTYFISTPAVSTHFAFNLAVRWLFLFAALRWLHETVAALGVYRTLSAVAIRALRPARPQKV